MGRILVVDDEELAREAIRMRLERDGHEVDTAASESEAIEKIRTANPPYDVVVTDMVMESENSGMEVLKAALLRDVLTEVIVLTAYGSVANAVECLKRGAFDYVEKNIPGVDVYDLLALKVDRAMEHRSESLALLKRWHSYQQPLVAQEDVVTD
ncbi:Virulence transcriptional regulatory protein PhoP [bacterium HR17]|uniref:Virulence transcriptional regulatory protein PhoP n=1 Tax=Candidatus Fervidibacter japonicus TaxID=2035412 RepID=A0A2H5XEJ3_9BACT|nr:Virulence transcriptional regulatory protein PhoP [bacterium HR17]